MKSILKIVVTVAVLFIGRPATCQENFRIRYINSKFIDKERNDVLVAFLVAVNDVADFPPVVNLPPQCTVFENEFEKKCC